MSFTVGQRVGDYEFLAVLATNPSPVYEVFNHAENRKETLKPLPSDWRRDRDRVERFLREAKIHSSMDHPNIAEFYAGFELRGQLVMTTEAPAGDSLERRLAERGRLEVAEALSMSAQALEALRYAHGKRVVHREITPANLWIDREGRVKLAGFELAKQTADPALTQPGAVIGAVHYMSPEQVRGLELDSRSDVYAVGVVLFEALTGRKPFDSKSQFDVIQAHVATPPPNPRDLREEIPPRLAAVLLRALEKIPDDRYQSATEFREALAGVSLDEEPATRPEPSFVEIGTESEIDGSSRPLEPDPEPVFEPPSRPTTPPVAIPARASAAATAARASSAAEVWSTRDIVIVGTVSFLTITALALGLMIAFST